jgi:hypothetical protein
MDAKLPALCKLLFEPFCVEYPYDAAHWRLGERVSDLLGNDRWNFRIAGPAGMILLLRAFQGLVYYLSRLEAPIFWNDAFKPHVAQFKNEAAALRLPREETRRADFSTLARYLKIRVTEHGRTKVELTCYASGIDDLDELLDADLRHRIASQNINLATVVADVRRRGYRPGPVFKLDEGIKQVDVWLE